MTMMMPNGLVGGPWIKHYFSQLCAKTQQNPLYMLKYSRRDVW